MHVVRSAPLGWVVMVGVGGGVACEYIAFTVSLVHPFVFCYGKEYLCACAVNAVIHTPGMATSLEVLRLRIESFLCPAAIPRGSCAINVVLCVEKLYAPSLFYIFSRGICSGLYCLLAAYSICSQSPYCLLAV